MNYDDPEDVIDEEYFLEHFAKRKDRRRPKGKRSIKALQSDSPAEPEAAEEGKLFHDPSLQALYERGLLRSLVYELQSGKEATVYLAEGPQGLLAAKVYRDREVRSFKNDQDYRQGRYMNDARIKKALERCRQLGLNIREALWIMYEYDQLWELHQAGLPVPRPLVGPGAQDIAAAGRVVLMEYLGERDQPAPRLSDITLEPAQAEQAFQESVNLLVALLALGKIHGDFSTFNLLWWREKVYMIDFPQLVHVDEHPQAQHLLERDVRSLCQSFKGLPYAPDPAALLADVRARAKASSA